MELAEASDHHRYSPAIMDSDDTPLLYLRTFGDWSYRVAGSGKTVVLGKSLQDRLIKELAVAPEEGIPQPELLRILYGDRLDPNTEVQNRNFRALLHSVRSSMRGDLPDDAAAKKLGFHFISPIQGVGDERMVRLDPDRTWIDHVELRKRLDTEGSSRDPSALLLVRGDIRFDELRDDPYVQELRDSLDSIIQGARDSLNLIADPKKPEDEFALILRDLDIESQYDSLQIPVHIVREHLVEQATDHLVAGKLVSMYGPEKVGKRVLLRAVARDALARFGWKPFFCDVRRIWDADGKLDLDEVNKQYRGLHPSGRKIFNFEDDDLIILRGWHSEAVEGSERQGELATLLTTMLGIDRSGSRGPSPRIALNAVRPASELVASPWITEVDAPLEVEPMKKADKLIVFEAQFRHLAGKDPGQTLVKSFGKLDLDAVSPEDVPRLADLAFRLGKVELENEDLKTLHPDEALDPDLRRLLDFASVFSPAARFSKRDLRGLISASDAESGAQEQLELDERFDRIRNRLATNPGDDSRFAVPESEPKPDEPTLLEARKALARYILELRETLSDIELVERRPETLDLILNTKLGWETRADLARLAFRYWAYYGLFDEGIRISEALIKEIEEPEEVEIPEEDRERLSDKRDRLLFNTLRMKVSKPESDREKIKEYREQLEDMCGDGRPFEAEARLELAYDLYTAGGEENLEDAHEWIDELGETPVTDSANLEKHRRKTQALIRMGWIDLLRSKAKEAAEHFEEAAGIARGMLVLADSPDDRGKVNLERARSLEGIGRAFAEMGQLEDAGKRLRQALEIEVRPFDRPRLAYCHLGLAEISRLKGSLATDPEQAAAHLRVAMNQIDDALSGSSKLEYRLAHGRLLQEKARILLTMHSSGHAPEGTNRDRLLVEATECFESGRESIGRAQSWLDLFSEYLEGRLAEEKNRPNEAQSRFVATLGRARDNQMSWMISRCESALARLAARDGQKLVAAEHLENAVDAIRPADETKEFHPGSPELLIKALDAAQQACVLSNTELASDLRFELKAVREQVRQEVLHPETTPTDEAARKATSDRCAEAVRRVIECLTSTNDIAGEGSSRATLILGVAERVENSTGGKAFVYDLSNRTGSDDVFHPPMSAAPSEPFDRNELFTLFGNAEQIDLLNTRASALIICGFDDTLSGPDPAPVVDGELVALPLDSLSEGAGAALPEPMGSFGHLTAFAICELMPVATSPGSPADGPPQKFGA